MNSSIILQHDQHKNDQQRVQEKKKSLKDTKFLSLLTLKCPSNNNGLFYCFSCQNNSVVCNDQKCQCQKVHENCQNMKKIKPFNIALQNKLIQTEIVQSSIEQIDKLINSLKRLQNRLQNQLKYFGLNKQQRNLSNKILNHSQNKNQELKNFSQYLQDLQKINRTWIQDDMKYYEEFKRLFKNFINEGLDLVFTNIKYQYYKLTDFVKKIDSNILQNQQQCQKMVKMFITNNQQIKKIETLYSASKDSFTVQAFNQKCNDKLNLLYLVHNEFDKKYGAYCPCPISKQRNKKWETDQSMKSFIFSIDQNIKANIIKKQFAIKNSQKSQKQSTFVTFGQSNNCNLIISQKSNQQQKDNWINFNGQAYQRKSLIKNQFRGRDISKCKLKQFQVFQLTMNDKK